jgi:hypothetical protein
MDDGSVMTDATTPATGPMPVTTCTCAVPVPEARATWKGAARTHCVRCGLPMRLDFAAR